MTCVCKYTTRLAFYTFNVCQRLVGLAFETHKVDGHRVLLKTHSTCIVYRRIAFFMAYEEAWRVVWFLLPALVLALPIASTLHVLRVFPVPPIGTHASHLASACALLTTIAVSVLGTLVASASSGDACLLGALAWRVWIVSWRALLGPFWYDTAIVALFDVSLALAARDTCDVADVPWLFVAVFACASATFGHMIHACLFKAYGTARRMTTRHYAPRTH